MNPHPPSTIKRAQRGAAFLLLVVALLLVVTGATLQLIQNTGIARRGLGQQARAETMLRAIEAAANSVDRSSSPDQIGSPDQTGSPDQAGSPDQTGTLIRLPLDPQQSIVIRIEATSDGPYFVAQWIHNEKVVDTMRRKDET